MKKTDEILNYIESVLFSHNIIGAGLQVIEDEATHKITFIIDPNSDYEEHKRINLEDSE